MGFWFSVTSTDHTKSGNIGGWHISKIIPFDGSLFVESRSKTLPKGIQFADITARFYVKEMKESAQKLLDNIAAGEKPFGVIEFDKALEAMNALKNGNIDSALKRMETIKKTAERVGVTEEHIIDRNNGYFRPNGLVEISARKCIKMKKPVIEGEPYFYMKKGKVFYAVSKKDCERKGLLIPVSDAKTRFGNDQNLYITHLNKKHIDSVNFVLKRSVLSSIPPTKPKEETLDKVPTQVTRTMKIQPETTQEKTISKSPTQTSRKKSDPNSK